MFFISHDDQYMIKTMRKEEIKLLLASLPRYLAHVSAHPSTLLLRFFGVHRVKPSHGLKVRGATAAAGEAGGRPSCQAHGCWGWRPGPGPAYCTVGNTTRLACILITPVLCTTTRPPPPAPAPHVPCQVRFVVMNNVFRTDVPLHCKYDLKGSTLGRTVGAKMSATGGSPTHAGCRGQLLCAGPAACHAGTMPL